MHPTRLLAAALVALLPTLTACADRLDGPVAIRPAALDDPRQLTIYDRYPTQDEYLAAGGRLAPTATATISSSYFGTDATVGQAYIAQGSVTFQHVNLMQALLSGQTLNTTSGAFIDSRQQSHNPSRNWPTIFPETVALRVAVPIGTRTCGVTGTAQLSASGTLRLFSALWLPIDLFSAPSQRQATPRSLPDCTQRSSVDEPTSSCSSQLVYSPATCDTGGGSSATGGGSGCTLWVRRIYVTYDGGRTWYLESETFFTKC